jgi:exodeoxyribonuclease V alpha subunit
MVKKIDLLRDKLLENPFFSYVDFFFAKKLLKDFDENTFIALAALFAISRLGHLSLKVDFKDKKVYPPNLPFEKEILEGLLNIPKKLIEKENFKNFPIKPICFFKNRFYLQKNFVFETEIFEGLKSLLNSRRKNVFDLKKAKEEIKNLLLKKKISKMQKEALENIFLENSISFIFGGPGTGKTYVATKFIYLLNKLAVNDMGVIIAAPTGKAADNLKLKICENVKLSPSISIKTSTLHSLLNDKGEGDFLDADFIIVDEASMIDAKIMAKLFKSVSLESKLILIGDVFQLPPVETKNLFSIFKSKKFSRVSFELKTLFRFENKELNDLAENVRKGDVKEAFEVIKESREIFFHEREEKIFEFVDRFLLSLSFDENFLEKSFQKFSKFQILSSTKRGNLGYERINEKIYEYLKSRKKLLAVPIIITKNDYRLNLFNGERGILVIGEDGKEKSIYFRDRKVPFFMVKSYQMAFCISVHKSQGSEYDSVFLVLPENSTFFGRELLYTAVTRAKKKIEILGKEKTIAGIIENTSFVETALLERVL